MKPHVSHVGVHDHGFNNVSTYGNLRRLMLEGRSPANEWERNFYELALKISGAVQAGAVDASLRQELGILLLLQRAALALQRHDSIDARAGGEPAYTGASSKMGEREDTRIHLLGLALQHAETTARYNVYFGNGRDSYDVRGRVVHESIFNTNDGSYRCPSTQQGYSPFTTWTRGQAWIRVPDTRSNWSFWQRSAKRKLPAAFGGQGGDLWRGPRRSGIRRYATSG